MRNCIGYIGNLFWKSSLEDTSFFILKNNKGQIAHLSATAVEWKNIFVFEIILERIKIQINGLGRSYGRETLTLYKMRPEMGPPVVKEFDFDQEDNTWRQENREFFLKIKRDDISDKSIKDAKFVLETIEKIYKNNQI
ncbi:MAG: hypothetical protein ACD_7C00007G0002 [uncultured bacterium]|nr:MAG: hypothetical protein ACD_7C00007G0002 [uncultured bacterium]